MSIGCWTWKSWDVNLPETTWLVSTRISNNRACPTETHPLHTVRGATVPVVHVGKWMGKRVWVAPASGKGKPTHGIVFAQGLSGTCQLWGYQVCVSKRYNLERKLIFNLSYVFQEDTAEPMTGQLHKATGKLQQRLKLSWY